MSALTETASYILIPAVAPAIGALIAIWRMPGFQLQSIVQHIAAGLVFAAVAVELLPDLLHGGNAPAVALGFIAGVGLLLVIRRRTGGHHHGDADEGPDHIHEEAKGGSLKTLLAAIGIDVTVDGLLIGIGFAAGAKEGRLLTLALSVEALFLGLTILVACSKGIKGNVKRFLLAAAPGLILAAMALAGAGLFANLEGAWRQAMLAFGVAALLYLVTEELLTEAHESPDEPIETASFFGGFLLVLVLALL